MCEPGGVDDASYGVLTLALTLVGGTYAWWAFQRHGLGPALRGAGLALLPAAAYLTDTLRMVTRIGDAIGDWATGLVLSPSVWLGISVAALGALLFGVGHALERRRSPKSESPDALRIRERSGKKRPGETRSTRGAPAIDDDLAEIEALLRKRGIT